MNTTHTLGSATSNQIEIRNDKEEVLDVFQEGFYKKNAVPCSPIQRPPSPALGMNSSLTPKKHGPPLNESVSKDETSTNSNKKRNFLKEVATDSFKKLKGSFKERFFPEKDLKIKELVNDHQPSLVAMMENEPLSSQIPEILEVLLTVLEQPKMMQEENLFRISPAANEVKQFKEHTIKAISDNVKVFVLVRTLKDFLVNLPDGGLLGTIDPAVWTALVAGCNDDVKKYICGLPAVNQAALKRLVGYLLTVCKEPASKMDKRIAAISMWRTLVGTVHAKVPPYTVSVMEDLTEKMLENYEECF